MNLVGNELYVARANNWVSDEEAERDYRLHPKDAVVFAKIGIALTYNRRRRLTRPTVIDNNMMSAISSPEIDKVWFYYLLSMIDFNLISSGSALPYLTVRDLSRISVEVPSSTDQKAIALVLGALDNKIELNRRMNETLEATAQAIFKDWFVDFGPTRAKMEGRAPYLAADIWALFPDALDRDGRPDGWHRARLGDFTELQNGYAFKSTDWQAAGTPVVKIGSVKPTVVDLQQVSFVTQKLADDRSAFQLRVGDVLVGLTGYVGETGRVPPTANPPMLNQRVGRFSSSGSFSPFVYACVRDKRFKQYAEGKAHGSAQPNVSTKDLLDYVLVDPGSSALFLFEELAAPIFQKSLANFGEIAALAETRDFLLPKLMSGEVRVKDAEKLVGDAT